MEISKDLLTIQTGGVLRCCLSSLSDQIAQTEITEDSRLSCEHCGRFFVLSLEVKSHFVPEEKSCEVSRDVEHSA